MGLEQARRAIEHEVRAHFGPMLSAMWHITSSLKAINTTISVPHMAGIRPIAELRELERKIERAVSPYCMERITVDVAQNWDGGGQVWINIGRERGGMEETIESVVKRFIDGCTAMEWSRNPIAPERMATLTIQHGLRWWKDLEKKAFHGKLRAATAGDPQRMIWGLECGAVETKVHIIKPEEYSIPPRSGKVRNTAEAWRESAMACLAKLDATPEANAPHTFFTKRLSMDEHHSKKGRWVSLEERRRAEQAVARVVEGTERFTWHFDADSEKRMLEVNHRNLMVENPDLDRARMANELWREMEKAAPYMDVLRLNIGDEETRITFGPARHLEYDPIASTNAFCADGAKVDEPLFIIRDELGDWTREQRQKKTEERKMFSVNKIVAITEETKAIKLVVHKEETQKEMAMTAQVAAQHQNDTVWKVDVAGDVLVLHVGYVKD